MFSLSATLAQPACFRADQIVGDISEAVHVFVCFLSSLIRVMIIFLVADYVGLNIICVRLVASVDHSLEPKTLNLLLRQVCLSLLLLLLFWCLLLLFLSLLMRGLLILEFAKCAEDFDFSSLSLLRNGFRACFQQVNRSAFVICKN